MVIKSRQRCIVKCFFREAVSNLLTVIIIAIINRIFSILKVFRVKNALLAYSIKMYTPPYEEVKIIVQNLEPRNCFGKFIYS